MTVPVQLCKVKRLRRGVKRIVHVLAKNLAENMASGANLPLVGVRLARKPRKLQTYRHADILGPCRLEHVTPDKALPDTNGRGICYLVTDAAILVYND